MLAHRNWMAEAASVLALILPPLTLPWASLLFLLPPTPSSFDDLVYAAFLGFFLTLMLSLTLFLLAHSRLYTTPRILSYLSTSPITRKLLGLTSALLILAALVHVSFYLTLPTTWYGSCLLSSAPVPCSAWSGPALAYVDLLLVAPLAVPLALLATYSFPWHPSEGRTLVSFSELSLADELSPSLFSADLLPPGLALLVADYLDSAPCQTGLAGVDTDLITGEGDVFVGLAHCDSVYWWPSELSHYVRTHHLAPPSHFLDHVLARLASLV